jgi:hypothetical protein
MVIPPLSAWIVEPNQFTGHGIERRNPVALVVIAE